MNHNRTCLNGHMQMTTVYPLYGNNASDERLFTKYKKLVKVYCTASVTNIFKQMNRK